MSQHFEVVCVQVRDPVKGQVYADRWQLPVVNTLPELLEREEPEFVIVSVSQPAAAEVIASVASTGLPVLTETPPGQTMVELERLTALTRNGAHIQVAEQYPFQPLHAARITLARDGRLGDITQAQVSAAHGYRGVSLMRLMLGVDFEDRRSTPLASSLACWPVVAEQVGPLSTSWRIPTRSWPCSSSTRGSSASSTSPGTSTGPECRCRVS